MSTPEALTNEGFLLAQLAEECSPEEAGRAVEQLIETQGSSYLTIAERTGRTPGWLRIRHRLVRDLPAAIVEQVTAGTISLTQAGQILRLEGEDRWVLAVAIVHERAEEHSIPAEALRGAVSEAVKAEVPIADALDRIAGVRFNSAPNIIRLFEGVEDLTVVYRAAWERGMKLEDYVSEAVIERAYMDVSGVADALEEVACKLRRLSRKVARPIAEGSGEDELS